MTAETIRKRCAVCDGEHEVRLAELKRGWGQTCSRSCGTKLQRAKAKERDPESMLLPRCGVTDAQVLDVIASEPNARRAARKLGVAEDHLRRVALQHGLKFNRRKPRRRCISADDIVALAREGYTRKDSAYLLGISPSYLKDLIALWGLAKEFVLFGGRAALVTRRGYA